MSQKLLPFSTKINSFLNGVMPPFYRLRNSDQETAENLMESGTQARQQFTDMETGKVSPPRSGKI